MEGTRSGSMNLAVFVTTLVLLLSGLSTASAEKGLKSLKFTYYLHDDFIPPDTTSVQVASANGTLANARVFGDLTVFDSVLRIGVENDSTIIGGAGGEFVTLKGPSFITFVHDITFPDYAGTLTASARFNFSAPSWEVGISTGTGSFRGARGYFTVSLAVPNPAGYIFKYDATVYLPKSKF